MSKTPAVIGIDIGTTKICAVAVEQNGELLDRAARTNDATISGLSPGRAEQDPRGIRALACAAVRDLMDKLAASRGGACGIAAVGLTGQMHGMLCVDASNEPLSDLITWQDHRCDEPGSGGRPWLDTLLARVPAAAWDPCGCLPASGYLGATLSWLLQNRALPAATVRVACVHDWLAGVLAGRLPVTDPTGAGSTGVFDVARVCWHDEILRALEIPRDLLPAVEPTASTIGRVVPAAAAESGLPAGVPVCNALGDNQASILGSAADPQRAVIVNIGTGGQISWTIPAFQRVPHTETRCLPRDSAGNVPTIGLGYLLVSASLCGGKAYEWLNNVARGWMRDLAGEVSTTPDLRGLDSEAVYKRLSQLAAAAPPDCAGLRAATTFGGTRADPEIRGAWTGVSLENFTLGNVARAVLVGIVDELATAFERARAALGETQAPAQSEIVASGNAVRRNPLLRRIIAERFGRPVRTPRHPEEAAYGAALLAGVRTGLWPDLATAARNIAYDEYAST
ncbi:MAG: FGGY family carbohydrate kinase [Planctomycetota bacterium]